MGVNIWEGGKAERFTAAVEEIAQALSNGGGSSSGGGTSDYSALTNKPSINNVTLSGNKSLSDLGIASQSDLDSVNSLIGYQDILIGETPYTPQNDDMIKLVSDSSGNVTYTVSNVLVADMDRNQGITYNNVTYTKEGKTMTFVCSGDTQASCYFSINVSGLTIGSTYIFETNRTYKSGTSPFSFEFYTGNGTLVADFDAEADGETTYNLTATDTELRIDVFPVGAYAWSTYNIKTGTCESLGLYTTLTGTFTNSITFENLKDAEITTSPVCSIYRSISRMDYREVSAGTTPYTMDTNTLIKFVPNTNETVSYTVSNILVADLEKNEKVDYRGVTYSNVNGVMTFHCTEESRDSSYFLIKIPYLVVGDTYTFKTSRSYQSGTSPMSFVFYDSEGTSFGNLEATSTGESTFTFTATDTLIRIFVYPVTDYAWTAYSIRDGTCNSLGLYTLRTGSFSGETYFDELDEGLTITTSPVCSVYKIESRADAVLDENSTNPIQNKAVAEALKTIASSRHYGKKCVFLGDSVAAFNDPPEDIPSVFAEETGMTAYNCAFGGCRISDTDDSEGYLAFNFVQLVDAITTNTWTLQDANIDYLETNDSSGYSPSTHYATLKSMQWNNIDYCIIFFAGNDPGNVAIDDDQHTDSTSTYLGSFRYGIKTLLTTYPHLKFLIIGTDYHRTGANNVTDTDEVTWTRSWTGTDVVYHYYDWSDALMEECKNLKIPCLDWYRSNGLNSLTVGYYMADGKHTNYRGSKLLGGQIAAKFLATY